MLPSNIICLVSELEQEKIKIKKKVGLKRKFQESFF